MTQPMVEQILERLDRFDAQLQSLQHRVDKLEGRPAENEAAPSAPPTTVAATPPPLPPAAAPRPIEALTQAVATPPPAIHEDIRVPPPRELPATPPPLPAPGPDFDIANLLRRFHLMPPTAAEGENMEIQIGTWWATRIGVLLAIIAAVFFGIYMAQFSRPWLRLAELTTVAAAFTGLGLWLERRDPRYGSALVGGGLAMIFFCAFGAYAVPAIKVLDSPVAGALLQCAAAAAIIGAALWRDSAIIANMGVIFGFVACFFSFYAGLSDFALLAGLTLAASAAWFYQWHAWPTAYVLSMPLSYLLYFVIFTGGWLEHKDSAPGFWGCQAYLLGFLGIYAATDAAGMLRGRLLEPLPRRLIQLGSSSAAVLLGFWVTHELYHAQLSPYYFTYGIVLTVLALGYYLAAHPDALMHGYFLNGSALITIGLINALGGRTRWIALGVESIVLLFSARRSRLRVAEFMMGAVWVISLYFFAGDLARQTHLERSLYGTPLNVFSVGGSIALVYVLLSALFLGLQARWLERPEDRPEERPPQGMMASPEVRPKAVVNVFYTLLLSVAILTFAYRYAPARYTNLTVVLTLAAVGAVGYGVRQWIPFAALAFPLGLTNFAYWHMAPQPALPVWINGLAVIAATAAVAAALDRQFRARPEWRNLLPSPRPSVLLAVTHLVWMFSLQMLFGKVFADTTFLLLAVLSSAAIAAAAQRWRLTLLADLAPFIMAVVVVRLLGDALDRLTPGRPEPIGSEFFLWLAVALAWGYACAFALWKRLGGSLVLLKEKDAFQWVHGAIALLIGFFAIAQSHLLHPAITRLTTHVLNHHAYQVAHVLFWTPRDRASMIAFGIAALAVMTLARWPGFKPALHLAFIYLINAHAVFYALVQTRGALIDLDQSKHQVWTNGALARVMPVHVPILAGALVLAALTLAAAPLARRLRRDLPRRELHSIQWLCGGLTLALSLYLFAKQPGAMAHYATVCWGISAIVIFLVGLADRAKPLRITGLVGLALCIPRVFLVDVHSSLYRIAATGALGAVVLLVAFLYSKYRTVIAAWDREG